MKLNLDKEQLMTRIKAFEELNGRKPYIICSEKTYELLPEKKKQNEIEPFVIDGDWNRLKTIMDVMSPSEYKPKNIILYCGYTVFFDDNLEMADVIIA